MTHLSKDVGECLYDEVGIELKELRLPFATPLVGFHGYADGSVLNSLGLILFNKMDPMCQTTAKDVNSSTYQGSIFEQSEAAEKAITT